MRPLVGVLVFAVAASAIVVIAVVPVEPAAAAAPCAAPSPLALRMDAPDIGLGIELQSFSFGVSQTATQSGGGAGPTRLDVHDLSLVKQLDRSSAKLMQACANGKHFAEIKLHICADSGCSLKYLEYKMTDAIITSVSPGGSSGEDCVPTETITLSFDKIELTYNETNEKVSLGKKGPSWRLSE